MNWHALSNAQTTLVGIENAKVCLTRTQPTLVVETKLEQLGAYGAFGTYGRASHMVPSEPIGMPSSGKLSLLLLTSLNDAWVKRRELRNTSKATPGLTEVFNHTAPGPEVSQAHRTARISKLVADEVFPPMLPKGVHRKSLLGAELFFTILTLKAL